MATTASARKATEFRSIRKETRLLLQGGEGSDVEFKTDVKSIASEVLVSFANSPLGGWIIAGIQDDGSIEGCARGDKDITGLQNKASNCLPAVTIDVHVENTAQHDHAIVVVRVPPSDLRPHCTGKGQYTLRVQNRLQALDPSRLLAMFVERQGAQFLNRFKQAASDLLETTQSLDDRIGHIPVEIEVLLDDLRLKFEQTVEEAADGLASSGNDVQDELRQSHESKDHFEVNAALAEVNDKLDTLLTSAGINPDRQRLKSSPKRALGTRPRTRSRARQRS